MNTNMYLSTCCVQQQALWTPLSGWGLLPCVSHFHLERLRRVSSEIFLRARTHPTLHAPVRDQGTRDCRDRELKPRHNELARFGRTAQPDGPIITARISTYMGTGAVTASAAAAAAQESGLNWIFIKKAVVVVGCYSLGKQQGDSQNHFNPKQQAQCAPVDVYVLAGKQATASSFISLFEIKFLFSIFVSLLCANAIQENGNQVAHMSAVESRGRKTLGKHWRKILILFSSFQKTDSCPMVLYLLWLSFYCANISIKGK